MPERRGRVRRGQQGLLTILFTDLEASTAMTQRLGDARAQEIVRAHNTIVRREIAARAGAEVKHTGDGILATFRSAASAVAAAVAMQQASREYNQAHPGTGCNIAVGLNAGEPIAEDADVFGSAVQLAKRTCDQARGGQILATNVVRELVSGKGALFADAGTAELKGFDEPLHLFEVSAGAGGIDEGGRDRNARVPVKLLVGRSLAVVIIGGGVAAVALDVRGGGQSAAPFSFRELHADASFISTLNVLGGDCVASDLVIEGDLAGTWTGDIAGLYAATSLVTLPAEGKCAEIKIRSTERIADNEGNWLEFDSRTLSTLRIGNLDGQITPGTTTELETVGVIVDGAGRYLGASGTVACTFLASVQTALTTAQDGDCVVRLVVADAPAVSIAVAADAGEIGVLLNARGDPDTVKVYGIYRNNTGQPLHSVTMHVDVPDDVDLAVERAVPAASARTADLRWDIPSLQPGEVSTFELSARLQSARVDELALAIEIDAQGLAAPVRSQPIILNVTR